ncbi:Ig-like domain-containing protein [Candidatus Sulfurimonas baltica]|uniref:Cadherin domain-containing protein n=1 Tax=Candidatus Sulfurimonas baltica TaxID=2740404 RepID=A0A7S7LTA8_9BACT|nr:Ig-like domain-containing protein [Candidatus Sulfurimonas baltica]QOY50963.1 hypothetical protein HUE88_07345 [Candidatus Sulfurimonas baltica]
MKVFRLKAFMLMLVLTTVLQAGTLSNTSYVADSYLAGAKTNYTVKFTTQTVIPVGNSVYYRNLYSYPFTFSHVIDSSANNNEIDCNQSIQSMTISNMSGFTTTCRSWNNKVLEMKIDQEIPASSTVEIVLKDINNPATAGTYTILTSDIHFPADDSGYPIDVWPENLNTTIINNTAPTAQNITVTTDEDTSKIFGDTEANAINFYDANGDAFDSMYVTTLPTKGTLTLSDVNVTLNQRVLATELSNLKYTPVVNGNGTPYDSFGFKVNNGNLNSTSEYTVTINVTAVDDVPTIISRPITSVDKDSTYSYTLGGSDVDGDNLTWSLGTTLPSWLTLTQPSTTIETYGASVLRAAGTAMDSEGNIYVAQSYLYPDTDPAVALSIYKITPDSTTAEFATLDIEASARNIHDMEIVGDNIYISDYNSGKITTISLSNPQNGETLFKVMSAPMGLTYKDGFLYVGEAGTSKISKVEISTGISSVYLSGVYGYPKFDSSGKLYVATYTGRKLEKYDGTTKIASIDFVGLPTGVAITSDGSIYVPMFNFGTDYADAVGVKKVEADFSSMSDISTTGSILGIELTPSGRLVWSINEQNKLATLETSYMISGTPTSADVGEHNVSLVLSDGTNSVDHNFTITVNNVNDAPTANDFNFTIDEDTNKTFESNDFNFTDIDVGDSLDSIYITTLPSAGALTLSDVNVTLNQGINVADIPNLKFTPVANANGTPYATIGFKVNDGESNSTSAYTATINVNAVDDAPVIDTIGNFIKDEDSNDFNVTLNAVDAEGDEISYLVTSSDNSKVTVTIVDGKVVITPLEDANGVVTVTIRATSNGKDTLETFDVALTGVNDMSSIDTIFADINIQEDNGTSSYDLNISDVDGDALTVTMTSSDSGILMVSPNWTNPLDQAAWSQTLDYNLTTVADANGEVTITVTVRDENDAAVSKTFTVDVTPVNDAPEFAIAETKIVYKNFVDVNITLLGTDVEEDPLTYTAVIEDDSLASVSFTNNVLIFEAIDGAVGSSDINITLSDGDLNVSNILHFTVLPLEDGEDVEKVGVVDYESDENGTTTTLSIDNNLTISTKEDTNGTVTHEITVAGKVITATSDLNGSEVAFTESGVKTTYSDVNLSLEVNASVTGEASHILTVAGKTTTATSEKVGASTRINKDVNGSIEIVTSVDVNGTQVSVKAKADGTAEHSVVTPSGTSIATSKVVGAATVIKATGEVQTEVGTTEVAGYAIRAVVITNTDGTTHTQFERVSTTDKNDRTIVSRTLKESTAFDAGNNVQIDDINGVLYIKTQAHLTTDLVIE